MILRVLGKIAWHSPRTVQLWLARRFGTKIVGVPARHIGPHVVIFDDDQPR